LSSDVLYKYQKRVVDFIVRNRRCCIFLEMGLGKTVICLEAMKRRRALLGKVLIVVPASIITFVWQEENEKWGMGFDIVACYGSPKRRKELFAEGHDIYLISVDNLRWFYEKRLYRDFDFIIIDEFSMFKNTKSIRYKTLKKIMPGIRRFIGLTGTPITNNVYDLWGLIYLLDNGQRLFSAKYKFQMEWFRPAARNGAIIYSWKPRPGATDEILDKVSDIAIAMKACDYITLPDFIEVTLKVDLENELQVYKTMEMNNILNFKNGIVEAQSKGVLINKLLQIANGTVYYSDGFGYEVLHDYKIKALKSIVEQADSNMIVYCLYKHDQQRIIKALEGCASRFDYKRWIKGKVKVMVVNPQEMGYGLNLQEGGSIVVWYSPIYDMELYKQANARLYRTGQRMPVRCYFILAKDTIDEVVHKVLHEKEGRLEYLYDYISKL
jgi:SNF2 family DNA or RNA helicase